MIIIDSKNKRITLNGDINKDLGEFGVLICKLCEDYNIENVKDTVETAIKVYKNSCKEEKTKTIIKEINVKSKTELKQELNKLKLPKEVVNQLLKSL